MSFENELINAKETLWDASASFLIQKVKKNRGSQAYVLVAEKSYALDERQRQLFLAALSELVAEGRLVRQAKGEVREVFARSEETRAA